MNTLTLTEVAALILPGILVMLVPYFSPRRYFFGITVCAGLSAIRTRPRDSPGL